MKLADSSHSHHRRAIIVAFIGMFWLVHVAAWAESDSKESSKPTPFTSIVRANFEKWDTNHDGTLSREEVNQLLEDPTIKGDDAAALAAIKGTCHHRAFTPITLSFLREYQDGTDQGKRAKIQQVDGANVDYDYDKVFIGCKGKIDATARELFARKVPHLEDLKQSHFVGDCYFLAGVGSLLNRDPRELCDMMASNSDHSFTVRFRNGNTQTVSAPTDAEVALGACADRDGLWATVLEKAYEKLRQQSGTSKGEVEEGEREYTAIDGGSPRMSIEVMTGHSSKGRLFPNGAAECEKFAPAARKMLSHMNTTHSIAATAVGPRHKMKEPRPAPPAVGGGHVYGVLGFDEKTDRVTLWNPMGINFSPTGSEGLENGYETKNGIFSMPLIEFLQVYSGIGIELLDAPRKAH